MVAEVGAKRIIQVGPSSGAVTEIAGNLPIGLPAVPGGLPSNIPDRRRRRAGVIYFSSDVENAIYTVVRKWRGRDQRILYDFLSALAAVAAV